MEKAVYDIWLSLTLTPGTDSFARLCSRFCSAEEIFLAELDDISAHFDSKSRDFGELAKKDLTRAADVFAFCKRHSVGLLSYFDDEFPDSLRKIPTPPALLYYRGKLPDFKRSFLVSIVGTRSLSKYGRKNAFNIAYDLAKAGSTVVSGMAHGIDGVAAAGALSAGGVTIAVLGSGIDVCYPAQHKLLAREIVKRGCVFTEFAPGTRPERYNFPKRNRIISGLSAATLVIEGQEKSGALITARHAEEQGRTVYALPGNVESKNSEVSNLLLKNGARACTSADDIVRDFEHEYSGIINPFLLDGEKRPDLHEALSRFSVSAVSAEDDIFDTRPKKRSESVKSLFREEYGERKPKAEEKPKAEKEVQSTEAEPARIPTSFDEKTLRIYKKIPSGESCLIESLVDSEDSLRDVMKSLLKLEMGRFVKMLPGERVARNL